MVDFAKILAEKRAKQEAEIAVIEPTIAAVTADGLYYDSDSIIHNQPDSELLALEFKAGSGAKLSLAEKMRLRTLQKEGYTNGSAKEETPSIQTDSVPSKIQEQIQGSLGSLAQTSRLEIANGKDHTEDQTQQPDIHTETRGEPSLSQTEDTLPQVEAPVVTPVSGHSQAPVQVDAKAVIASHIQQETAKLSLADRIRLRKEAEKLALEVSDLASEPPETLPSSIAEQDPAAEIIVPEAKAEDPKATFSLSITLTEEQLIAKEYALNGKSYCLIGAAGTGKTTTQRDVAKTLVQDKRLSMCSYKIPKSNGARVDAPSIAFVAFTNRASGNLRRAIHKDPDLAEVLAHNIMTIHALLEYEPETYWDAIEQKEKFRFTPRRNAKNPLTITHLVIEEASMLGLDLWEALYAALPMGVQIIFIGDINQLPPVFGASILNYALVQLPVVELTKVHRQAEESFIIANAHRILRGDKSLIEDDKFRLVKGKSPVQVGQEKQSIVLAKMFEQWYDLGFYNPEDSIILSPWNVKPLGTHNMNHWIAQFLGKQRNAVVWEVIAGFNKLYLAVGDRVMYEKQDAVITEIAYNGMYHGKEAQMPGADLSRFGVRILGETHMADIESEELTLNYQDFSVSELEEQAMERKKQASHIVTIETETGEVRRLQAAGDFGESSFSLGYVLTVHKAQGCEWRKVFILLHKDQTVSLTRELFYTAVTRAREECIIIAKDDVIQTAIKNQRIKGNTVKDKIEYFNSGALDLGAVRCTK